MAFLVLILGYITNYFKKQFIIQLAFLQILFTLPLPFIWSISFTIFYIHSAITVVLSALFCAIFATIIAIVLQTKYQKYTTTLKAALIYSLTPVFASIFGITFGHDPVNVILIIGESIILIGILFGVLAPLK